MQSGVDVSAIPQAEMNKLVGDIAENVLLMMDDVLEQVSSHDPSDPQVVLRNVADPLEVHEIIRRAVLEARKKHRLYYQEEM